MLMPRLVVAHGVFDQFSVRDLRFLQWARSVGERLVVVVFDDGPVVVPLAERAVLLSALDVVCEVVSFSSPDISSFLLEVGADCLCVVDGYADSRVLGFCERNSICVMVFKDSVDPLTPEEAT